MRNSIQQNSFVIYFFQVEGEATQRAIVIADQVNLDADTPVIIQHRNWNFHLTISLQCFNASNVTKSSKAVSSNFSSNIERIK